MSIPPGIPLVSRTALEEAQRIMRRQDELLRLARGPYYDLQQQLKAAQGPAQHYEELRRSGILDQLAKASELYNEHKRLWDLVEPNWLKALNDASRAVNQFDAKTFRHLESLSDTLAQRADVASQSLLASQGVLSAATANMLLTTSFTDLMQRFSSDVALLRATSEMALTAEMMVLRASPVDTHVERAQALRLEIIDIQQLTIELQQAAPQERANLLAVIVAKLASIIRQFGKNSLKELKTFGLFGVIGLFASIGAIAEMILPKEAPPAFTPIEIQSLEETHTNLRAVVEAVQEIKTAFENRDRAFLADYPRGELRKATNIRTAPNKKASRVIVADPGTHVAIAETVNGWDRIYYEDPLTDELATGWVPSRSVLRF